MAKRVMVLLFACSVSFFRCTGSCIRPAGVSDRTRQSTTRRRRPTCCRWNVWMERAGGRRCRCRSIFEGLRAVNRDVIGWIFIEGTDVNYPLLAGADNQQYLFQSYMKKYAVAGSIFWTIGAVQISDYHTVIYGHNMKNGMMFGELDAYQKAAYLASLYPHVYIIMADGRWNKYRVLACEHVSVESAVYDLPSAIRNKRSRHCGRSCAVQWLCERGGGCSDAADGALQGAAQGAAKQAPDPLHLYPTTAVTMCFAVHCVLEEMGKSIDIFLWFYV